MAKAIRPVSIRVFEALVYIGLTVGVVSTILYQWAIDQAITWFEVALILALFVGINLLFVWLIAYRANNVMKWIFVVLVVIGTVFFVIDLVANPQTLGWVVTTLEISVYVLSAIEIVLLFRRDASDWFAGRQRVDPDIFS